MVADHPRFVITLSFTTLYYSPSPAVPGKLSRYHLRADLGREAMKKGKKWAFLTLIIITAGAICGFSVSLERLHDRLILTKLFTYQAETDFQDDRVVSIIYPSQRQRNPINNLRRRYTLYHFNSRLYAMGDQILYTLEPLAGPRPGGPNGGFSTPCSLATLPADVGRLTELTNLVLLGCDQLILPPEIGQLSKLERLTIIGSGSGGLLLPPEIGQLKQLKRLTLQDMRVNYLPPEIGQLENLELLNLTNLDLRAIPPEISQLTKLRNLTLTDNRLTELPPQIGQMTELRILDLWGNQLTTLPTTFTQLQNLSTLNLGGNQFIGWPAETLTLPNLQKLDLSHNQVDAIPTNIDDLASLQTLYIRDSGLTEIPRELQRLPNLTRVSLKYETDSEIDEDYLFQLQKMIEEYY